MKEDVASQILEWNEFYKECFRLKRKHMLIGHSEVPSTARRGFDQLIVVRQGLLLNEIVRVCSEVFPKTLNHIGDPALLLRDSRNSERSYAVRTRTHGESRGGVVEGITLSEHLLYTLYQFWKTGNNLNLKKGTVCSGSPYSNGNMPIVFCTTQGRFCLGWCVPSLSVSGLRVCEVIR